MEKQKFYCVIKNINMVLYPFSGDHHHEVPEGTGDGQSDEPVAQSESLKVLQLIVVVFTGHGPGELCVVLVGTSKF